VPSITSRHVRPDVEGSVDQRSARNHRSSLEFSILKGVVDQCQVLIGQSLRTVSANLIPSVRELLAGVPAPISMSGKMILGSVLVQLVGRSALRVGVDDDVEVARGFAALAASMSLSDVWRAEFEHLLECYTAACQLRNLDMLPTPSARVNVSVDRALRFISTNYTNPGLTLRDVAIGIRRSAWHTGRTLKRVTGVGFVAHLRHRRVRQAQGLLRSSSLTMKEIAATVGFHDASQFSRDFRCVCGVSPVSFRIRTSEQTR
jgi:AraC-like DNA-binding protein